MNSTVKQRIANQFSRAACGYDNVADIQWQIGQYAVSLIQQTTDDDSHILDVGCGTGRITQLLSAYSDKLTAIDLAPGMIQQAIQNDAAGTVDWQIGDAESLPMDEETVDTVFSSMALQWCPSPERVFAEVYRVLRCGGTGVVGVVSEGSLVQLSDHAGTRVNQYPSPQQWQQYAENAGLTASLKTKCFTAWYPSIKMLLASIRKVGANVVTNQSTTFDRQLRQRIQRQLEPHYCQDRGYPLTYNMAFLVLNKVMD